MNKHLLRLLGTVIVVAGIIWILLSVSSKSPTTDHSSSSEEEKPPPSPEQKMGDRTLVDYASPDSDGQKDIQLFYDYLTNVFLLIKNRDSHQYAINEDLSAFLRGKNNYKTVFISPDSHIFNDEKLIIDRWGTPIHIHTISSDRFELRSAGPDRKHATEDDFFWPPKP